MLSSASLQQSQHIAKHWSVVPAGAVVRTHLAVKTTPLAARVTVTRALRSDWRSSWRTELENGSNGNGNGNGVHYIDQEDDTYVAYSSEDSIAFSWNGNGSSVHGDTHERNSAPEPVSHYDWRQNSDLEDPELHDEAHDWRGDPSRASSWEEEEDASNGAFHGDAVPQSSGAEQDEEPSEESSSGFFSSAFQDALRQALQRSPMFAHEAGIASPAGSGDEEDEPPQPADDTAAPEAEQPSFFTDGFRAALSESLARSRQMAEIDAFEGSDDEYVASPYVSPASPYVSPASPYVPSAPPRAEMSPLEEVLATALGASQMTLRRLALIKGEIETALEREARQAERLQFALDKARTDAAYYKSVEEMARERRRV